MAQPEVCVVVATHGRAHLLERLVRALAAQEAVGGFEAVVVDDASPDDTWSRLQDLAADFPFVVPVRLERNSGPATARNRGWQATRAPLVAFTDDDCVPQPGWLAAVVSGLRQADVVQGRTLPDPVQVQARGPFSHTITVESEQPYYQTCNMGYRRDRLVRQGGFDERFRHAGEDMDLAWRALEAGARLRFETDALVYHDVRPSDFGAHLRSLWRWQDIALLVREHPQLRRLLHRGLFFRQSHPTAILAGAGLCVAADRRAPQAVRLAAGGLLVPYWRVRTRTYPLHGGPRRRRAAVPAALLADLWEVAVIVVGAVRHRTLVL